MDIVEVVSVKIKQIMENIQGEVRGKVLQLRFAFAGKVAWVGMEMGDIVRAGQELAKLDITLLSKKHARELADYEKIRATFEQLRKKLENSNEPDKKYLIDKAQADLNSAVAAVEISHFEMEQAVLRTPVSGIVSDDGGLAAGINISPASFAVKITVSDSLFVESVIGSEKVGIIKKDQYAEFDSAGRIYKGRVRAVYPLVNSSKGNFVLKVVLETTDGLMHGISGRLSIFPER